MKLTEKALTIELNIGLWSARCRDKQVTSEIEAQKEANNAGNFNKILIPNKFTKGYVNAAKAARDFHEANTMPWADRGPRLLPSENYMFYKQGMIEKETIFRREVDKFLEIYHVARHEARLDLGLMFNEADYPTRAQLEKKFKFKTTPFDISQGDFRVTDLGQDEITALKASVQREIQERLDGATKDLWNRVKEQLSQMKEKFSNPDSRIYASMFENLRELIDVLPRLNVVEDPNLKNICEEMKTLLVEPDTIRNDEGLKAAKAKEVEDVMNRFKDYF